MKNARILAYHIFDSNVRNTQCQLCRHISQQLEWTTGAVGQLMDGQEGNWASSRTRTSFCRCNIVVWHGRSSSHGV